MKQGLLVHGSNHFIVNGSAPAIEMARWLVRKWEMPMLGKQPDYPLELEQWSICTKAFRENLEWAVVLDSENPHSEAAAQLLGELSARGVAIEHGRAPL